MDRANWIWQPTQTFIESTNVWQFMRSLGFEDREEFLAWSRDNIEEFWDRLTSAIGVEWFEPYDRVLDTTAGVEWAKWFSGGKLNIAHNCLDRYASSERTAILWESENGATRSISFAELSAQVSRLANGLRAAGLVEGDRVAMVMPMVPEIVTILYACFKLGLVVVPIFSGFGESAIAMRLENSGARIVFTAETLERRGKRLPLANTVRAAAAKVSGIARIVTSIEELAAGQSESCATASLSSEAPCLILYTSGTTGKPKGCVHTHAGALVQTAKEIWLGFDHKPADRFFWLSDIGWMMGAWTIIGNHHFGGTILLYDGAPDWPDPDRMWQVLEHHGITTFGVSPTAIRVLMRGSHPERFSFDALRLLGSTGEPWDETSYLWFFNNIGKRRCPIINISGGTEIIGCFLFPLPIQPLKPCTLGAPAPGMAVEVVDEEGRPVRGRMGYLVCTKPAPSMTRGVWGDPVRYRETYWSRWPGWWNHGDWARVDEDGCWFLHGRADESMNVAGRKVGPAEVEDALMEHPAVSEAAVIGVPDEIKGEAIVAFVVLTAPVETAELIAHVATTLGPAFRPRAIEAVPELPKTQSGKIVRRLMRQQYLGEPLGDTSTVQNPAALNNVIAPSRNVLATNPPPCTK
jgi:acetyl-CoA synthetase